MSASPECSQTQATAASTEALRTATSPRLAALREKPKSAICRAMASSGWGPAGAAGAGAAAASVGASGSSSSPAAGPCRWAWRGVVWCYVSRCLE